tara:strand:- start:332 stop:502 length:171 start_codon:yes stop_codon:yes gene_type:complete
MGNIFEAIMEINRMTDLETIKRLEKTLNLNREKNEKPRKLHRSKRQTKGSTERPSK